MHDRSQVSLAQSEGVLRRRSVVIEKRQRRYSKTPPQEKIPGLDISEITTEKLEYLVSLEVNTPSTRDWKIKAAHELAARFIEGDASLAKHKAPCDHAKAYHYAQIEINTLPIEELEVKFFNLSLADDASPEPEVPIFSWQNIGSTVKKIKQIAPGLNKRISHLSFIDKHAIEIFIAKTNDLLNKEKAVDPNGIIFAWEKQLAAARLAEHYRKLKKEKRDSQNALAAKFYKESVKYFANHEPPGNLIISMLLKIISPRFNALRLFIVRLNKLLTQINTPLLSSSFLKWFASLAGLYFLLELIVDLRVLIHAGLFNAAGVFAPSWQRLVLSFWEDNRPSRMANALVWFSINLACLMLTLFFLPIAPILAPILIGLINIAGCVFDVGVEVCIGAFNFHMIDELLEPIDAELAKLADIDVNENAESTAGHKQKVTQKISLLEMREQLIKKRVALELNRAYTVLIMSILVIAAICIFFPPIAFPMVPLIAACAAFTVGSVFGGLGKHLFWNAPELYQSGKELVLKGCRTIKEYFVGKVKAPLQAIQCADDLQLNTKQIHYCLASPIIDSPNLDQPWSTANRRNQINYELHRSPSGTLFLPKPKPETIDVKISPPARLIEPKNLKPM